MADANTVYENIQFTPNGEIDRMLPVLLSDNAKLSVMVWNKFCDKIDRTVKPVARVKLLSKCLWFIVLVMIILNFFGWKFAGVEAYYGLIVPITFIFMILFCYLESHIVKKVASQLSKECASASNLDKNLRITLEGTTPETWYLQVAVRNASLGVPEDDIEMATDMVPPSLSDAVVTEDERPPKKYVKMDGKLILNPNYVAWKNANK